MILRKRTIIDAFSDNDEIFEKRENYFKIFICKGYNIVVVCFIYIHKSIKFIIKIAGIYLLWIFLHYLAAHLYVRLCVPNTIIGFLMSPFMTATPHCQGLRWIVYNAANMINNMWIVLGAWICSTLLLVHNDNNSSPTSSS